MLSWWRRMLCNFCIFVIFQYFILYCITAKQGWVEETFIDVTLLFYLSLVQNNFNKSAALCLLNIYTFQGFFNWVFIRMYCNCLRIIINEVKWLSIQSGPGRFERTERYRRFRTCKSSSSTQVNRTILASF